MNIKPVIVLLHAMLVPLLSMAQLVIDKPIILSSPDPEDHRVQGLMHSVDPLDALTAGTAQNNQVQIGVTTQGDHWSILLPSLESELVNGIHVIVRAPAMDPQPVNIILNGNGPYPLQLEGTTVSAEQIVEGTMISMVFADGIFHILNGHHGMRRACPTDMVAVNGLFCIEPTERPSADLFQAGLNCAANGRRLCTWGEFVGACQRSTELGLTSMTNNWEWTGTTSNEDNCARIAGSNNCTAANSAFSTGSFLWAYRCCFTR